MTTLTYTFEYEVFMKRVVWLLCALVIAALGWYGVRTYNVIHTVAMHSKQQKQIVTLERKVAEQERIFAQLQQDFNDEAALAAGYVQVSVTVARGQ